VSDANSSTSKRVSTSAISRVLALQAAELNAARSISAKDYPDFFSDYVDKGGGQPPWHEGFQDVIIGHPFEEFPEFALTRMTAIDALHLGEGEGYADFFVEGGGGNWHEAVIGTEPDALENHRQLSSNVSARMAALSKSNVLQAYSLLKTGGFAKE
jgi:hypothetical protein